VIVADTVGGVNTSPIPAVVYPEMQDRRSNFDWLLEVISAAALVTAGADVAIHWSAIPARIPVHFDAGGNPNAWGAKNMLLFLLATTVVVAIVLTMAESRQRLINIPMKVDRDSPAVRQLLRSMVIAMKAVITVSFVWIVDLTMRTAVGEANGLGRGFLPVFLGGIFAPLIYYLVKLHRL
jgi:uncharacterized membrane protein